MSVLGSPFKSFQTYVESLLGQSQSEIWASIVQIVLSLLLLTLPTRALTQLRSTKRSADVTTGTQSIQRVPYWLPYFGSSLEFFIHSQSWLLAKSRAYHSGVFAFKLTGRDYIIITSPALQAQLSAPSSTVSASDRDISRRRRFFSVPYHRQRNPTTVSSALSAYTHDKSRTTKVTNLLKAHTYNLVSPAKSWVDQAQWERNADVKVLATAPTLSVSASLPTLLRDFASHVVFSTLIGTSFVEANPNFIHDFFDFSSKYAMFMTGAPYWLAPGLGQPALAREKCLLALDGLVNAVVVDALGEGSGGSGIGLLYDTDDVFPALRTLAQQGVSKGSNAKQDIRSIACEWLEVLWHVNYYATNMVIWLVVYLSMEGNENKLALANVREELKTIVQVSKPKPSGLPFEDPPRLEFFSLDVGQKCPTLLAALKEVERLETEREEYLVVEEDYLLHGDGNARGVGRLHSTPTAGTEKYQLKRGDQIYVAYGATNKDTQYWDRPRRFVPGRFKSNGNSTNTTGTVTPRSSVQTELQSEVLCITAALLSFYEFDAMHGSGGLEHPGTSLVAGIGMPKKDLKARVSRRKT